MNSNHNILVCPLEWGLGHAGRMIPLVRKLQETGNKIFIGTGNEHILFFRDELPGLSFIRFSGFKPSYSRILPQYIALLFKIPSLGYHTISEHFRLKRIIRDHNIDIVISDNRFGLWNKTVRSVYITHQVRIPFPRKFRSFEWIGIRLHRYIIKKYDYCFIPDLPGDNNISGRLSHGMKLPENVRFIGILSRFNLPRTTGTLKDVPPHNTLILSGPEPQRRIFRQKVTELLSNNLPVVILEGKPGSNGNASRSGTIISYSHLPLAEMQEIISGSENLIARSGYTVIMELISLNCGALLIPTPGQTEQEYLAEYLSAKGWFTAASQKSLDSGITLSGKKTFDFSEIVSESRDLLSKALEELLNFPS